MNGEHAADELRAMLEINWVGPVTMSLVGVEQIRFVLDELDRLKARNAELEAAMLKASLTVKRYIRADALDVANKRNAELEAALETFVSHYDASWMHKWHDDADCPVYSRHTFGQLRRARELLPAAPAKEEDNG